MDTRTKIICTIGPSSIKPSMLSSLIKSGMDVARLNFSHGTQAWHKDTIRLVRGEAKAAGHMVAVLGDIQGPKIRLGNLPSEGAELKKGKPMSFTTASAAYKKGGPLPVTYANLHKDVKKGHRILIDDGLIDVIVTAVSGKTIRAKVVNGGKVTSHKGMNFPDSTLRISSLTEKDRSDAAFGVKAGVDWLALSFVISPENVHELRELVRRHLPKGGTAPRIMVKIEKHEAVERFDEILAVADGIMVARGDLGVEIPAAEVPVRQKEMIDKCRRAGKPVVVATQMLDSMIRNPRPTRAEVSDVANAVFDHTDAVMLSGETATGLYPREAVKMMAGIIREAEKSVFDDITRFERPHLGGHEGTAIAVGCLARTKQIHGVIANVDTAPWSERLLALHPEIPLFLVGADETCIRHNAIRWGTIPFVLRGGVKNFMASALRILRAKHLIKKGMRLAVISQGAREAGPEIVVV